MQRALVGAIAPVLASLIAAALAATIAPHAAAADDDAAQGGSADGSADRNRGRHGDPPPPLDDVAGAVPRTPDTSIGRMFRGPFRSARLFAMPTTDVVGAYILTLSGEGSLLQNPGRLTSAGVLAVGFGDIAQLEFRHTEAIGITGLDAPVPAVGVQLKLPIPERPNLPAFGVAFRLGVPRGELLDGKNVDETVTDLYLVGRLQLSVAPWLTLHGGTRISFAKAAPADPSLVAQRTLLLPTAGYEIAMNPWATIVGEIALAPQFQWAAVQARPTIGRGVLGRLGMKWRILPSIALEGSIGYQFDDSLSPEGVEAIVSAWDIRLGAAVFVPWGALACRAVGVFCNERAGARR
jgi:hypothetical protein